MNQEQRDIIASLLERLQNGNNILLETLDKLNILDQLEYLPRVQDQIIGTKNIIDRIEDMAIST